MRQQNSHTDSKPRRNHHPQIEEGPTLYPYLRAARALKLPFYYSNDYAKLEIRLGKQKYNFFSGFTAFNDEASSQLSFNKYYVNKLLQKAGFPVPSAIQIFKKDYLQGQWQWPAFDFPLVAKPTSNPYGNGKDVYCNIKDKETLIHYLEEHFKKYELITVEKYESKLIHYRVTLFFNRILGVVQHELPSVIGDGLHSIQELIAIENERRAKNAAADLEQLFIDREAKDCLREARVTLDAIPPRNTKMVLAYTSNAGRGATTHSLGTSICHENAELLRQAARLLNLNLVGFDVLCEDIQRPIQSSRGFIIEANCHPSLNLHEWPLTGPPVPAAQIVLSRLIYRHPISYLQVLVKQAISALPVFLRILFALVFFVLLLKWLRH